MSEQQAALKQEVSTLDKRMDKLENEFASMRVETQDGFKQGAEVMREIGESVANLAHDFGQRFNNIETTVVAEKVKWVRKWRVEPIVYTVEDYDAAMEDYLREVRYERGYTTREPDDYFGSSNPRWAQDAKDWVAFRDAEMTYALDIINTYTKTGNAPTLAAFKAGFPKMVWSYAE